MLSAPAPKIFPAGNLARGENSGIKTPNFSPRDNRVGGFADKKYPHLKPPKIRRKNNFGGL